MTLNIKNGHAIFFQIEDLDTRANFCEEWFYPASIKNDNLAVATRKILRRNYNQQFHQF